MSVKRQAVMLGLRRGWIETKHSFTNPQDMIWNLFVTGAFLLVLWLQRGSYIEGVQLALISLPGLLAISVASGGLMGSASTLALEREDGTLLRAKATPQGIFAYLISRIVYITLTTLLSVVLVLIPGLFIVEGLANVGLEGTLLFALLFLLGLFATVPIGVAVGAMVKTSNSGFGMSMLPMMILGGISGIFYPITALAGWIQAIAQIFPLYWLGHGMRSIFLPESAAATELHGEWQVGIAIAVLVAWSIVGMLFTPRLLKRMARKVSGSEMQANKERAMNRGY